MTEFRYVNRIDRTSLESPEVDGTPAPELIETKRVADSSIVELTTIVHSDELDTVEHELVGQPNGDQTFPDPGLVIEDWSASSPDHLSTAQVLAALLDRQIRFEARVIRALKHIGVDTRKFFGE